MEYGIQGKGYRIQSEDNRILSTGYGIQGRGNRIQIEG